MAYNLSLMQIAGAFGPTYENYYSEVDPQLSGTISAPVAAAFLKRSGLPDTILAKIWELSDPAGRGFLDKQGLFIALKLVALAQNGKDLNVGALSTVAPAPRIAAMAPSAGGGSRRSSLSEPTWEFGVVDRLKYDEAFKRSGPDATGKIGGLKIKELLTASRLSTNLLGHIWDLSDLDRDGALDHEEFAIMMFLVDKARQNTTLPEKLPLSLVPVNKRAIAASNPMVAGAATMAMPGGRRLSSSTSNSTPMPLHMPMPTTGSTGFPQAMSAALPPPAPTLTQVPAAAAALGWVVSDAERAQFEPIFRRLDTDLDGFLSGAQCRDLFAQSGLTQPMLAHVWTLCDMQSVGRLNVEQFCLAMHLIAEKTRRGVDLPSALEPSMVPPSMRASAPAATMSLVGGVVVQDPELLKSPEVAALIAEIDQIKSARVAAERDRATLEADQRLAFTELELLQKDLDAVSTTVRMLEMQKSEAQKRLDELDDKRKKLQSAVKEFKDKSEEEKREVDALRYKIASEQSTVKDQETELARMRSEVGALAHEEQVLTERAQTSRNQLEALVRRNKEMLSDMEKCKLSESRMAAERERLERLASQLDALLRDSSAAEPSSSELAALDADLSNKFPSIGENLSKFATDSSANSFVTPTFSTDAFKASAPAAPSSFDVGLFDPLGGAAGAKKAPPPRPAPPKAAPAAASSDAWAAFGSGPSGASSDPFGGSSSSASPWG